MTEQLSLFDSNPIRPGDKVILILRSEEEDPLTYNYLKSYFPNLIGKKGMVVGRESDKKSLVVVIDGTRLTLSEKDVVLTN